ncbi:MAG: hypothetical protein JNL54_17835 [Kineosporiaceae bacterium]|nr:hypothetical protein [Kineosporiaceae bacterium]MBL8931984.1 hypothetical protein [Kineosporiaceae bacterium]
MTAPVSCPRCGQLVRPPGLWSDAWTCAEHGAIAPVHAPVMPSDPALSQIARRSQVPLWLPWPLPRGWLVSGVQYAGDDHSGPVATALALSGPNPLVIEVGDALSADLVVVAEQPGVGFAARLAGLPGLDPGPTLAAHPSDAHLEAAGHATPMWSFAIGPEDPGDARAGVAYVGEALGEWLWVITWPRPATAVLLDHFTLVDLRDPHHVYDLPYGALSPRLD